MAINVIQFDNEHVYQVLRQCDFPRPAIEIIQGLLDHERALEQVINEMMGTQQKMIAALAVMNKGFQVYADRLTSIEKKFGDPMGEIITSEKPN